MSTFEYSPVSDDHTLHPRRERPQHEGRARDAPNCAGRVPCEFSGGLRDGPRHVVTGRQGARGRRRAGH